MLKLLWYIPYETLVTVLQVIKILDRDLKEKIVQIIVLQEKIEEENLDAINYNFNEYQDISDYWSE